MCRGREFSTFFSCRIFDFFHVSQYVGFGVLMDTFLKLLVYGNNVENTNELQGFENAAFVKVLIPHKICL